jgi:hypothetical protein
MRLRDNGMSDVMKMRYTLRTPAEVAQMDAYDLRRDLAFRLAAGCDEGIEEERFWRDMGYLAALAGLTVEATLTELHEDAELIDIVN